MLWNVPPGNGLTLLLTARDGGGNVTYTGQADGLTVLPADPFTMRGFVLLSAADGGVNVLIGGFPGEIFVELVPAAQDTPLAVTVDIKPGSDNNPVNVKSKGRLPVLVLGAADLDVEAIDLASVRLAGVAPDRHSIEDVASAVDGALVPDGYPDLILGFPTQDIVGNLGEVADLEVVELGLEASLNDGTGIAGADLIQVLMKGR